MAAPIIISFGGGKGGVGKSTIVTNIGATLSKKGFRVGYIDADLAGANLHTCLGVKRPKTGLQDFLSGKVKDISKATITTKVPNSWLLSGASDILDIANPHYAKKQKLLKSFKKLPADYILIDLGAGSSANITDFFTEFPNGVVVSDSMPTSIENAYSFLKNGLIRGTMRLFPGQQDIQVFMRSKFSANSENPFLTVKELLQELKSEFPIEREVIIKWLKSRNTFLVLNMVKNKKDLLVIEKFSEIVKKYLNVTIHYIGYLIYEERVRDSIRTMNPFVLDENSEQPSACISSITDNLIKLTKLDNEAIDGI